MVGGGRLQKATGMTGATHNLCITRSMGINTALALN